MPEEQNKNKLMETMRREKEEETFTLRPQELDDFIRTSNTSNSRVIQVIIERFYIPIDYL